ncbi:MAG: hypothetical protein KAW47_08890 [Thermoplasmatales archaeon]|nr:hypothetical protein [Thermoplasmatales archaeon]
MADMGNFKKYLKLNIADFVISIISDNCDWILKIDDALRRFVSESSPDIVLRFHYGQIPHFSFDEIVFKSSWEMYRSNGKYIIYFKRSKQSQPHEVMILEPDLKSGEVHVSDKFTPEQYKFALTYPLEVLMLILPVEKWGIYLHSCGIIDKGNGILFVGNSGTGKSTMAALWENKEGVTILSDDRMIIRKTEDCFWMYGTPWHGDIRLSSPKRIPLKRIVLIRHAERNIVIRKEGIKAASALLTCTFTAFWDKLEVMHTLQFLAELSETIPCYELGFVPDDKVVDFVRTIQ